MKNTGLSLTCMACMKPIETNQNYVNHHVTYFPETTITVHTSCHGLIHKSKKYPNLTPDLRQSLRWARKKGRMYWTWDSDINDYVWLRFMTSVEHGFEFSEQREAYEKQRWDEKTKKYWDECSRIKQMRERLNITQTWSS